jgi:hypothetical protein
MIASADVVGAWHCDSRLLRAALGGGLQQANDVSVSIFEGSDEAATADVFYFLLELGAGVEQRLERFLDIGDMDVAEGSGESGAVTVGDQANFLIADFEAGVVGFIAMRLDAQELAVERLGASDVFNGIDEGFDALGHGWISLSHLLYLARQHDDETRWGNVTDGRKTVAGGEI